MKKTNMLKSVVTSVIIGISAIANAQDNDYKIEVKTIEASKALIIKTEVQSIQIGQSMGEIYGKLFAFTGEKKIQPAGAPFAVYYKFDPQGKTEYEAGVPVNAKIEDSGDIKFKEYPAMKVVSVLYTGPYEGMIPVYTAIDKYIKDNNLKQAGATWEVYLTDPMETAPEKNQTIVYYPVK